MWVPTFWIIIIASRMVTQWFATSSLTTTQSYVDGSPLDAGIFLLLTVLAFGIVVARRIEVADWIGRNLFLCLYLVYCGISITWSDFPIVSLKRYIKELGTVFVVLVVLTDKDPIAAIKTVINRCAYVLVPYSLLVYKYYPKIGRGYDRWTGRLFVTGVADNKNSLGVLCAVSGLVLFWSLLLMWRHKVVAINKITVLSRLVVLATTLWLLWVADSATSKVCFSIGVAIVTATAFGGIRKHFTAYAFAGVLALAVLYLFIDVSSVATSAVGRDETLTGRTELWSTIVNMGTNAIVGCGYGSFWLGQRLETLWRAFWWHPTEAHNGYLETYLELGLVGNVLLIGVFASAFRGAFKTLAGAYDHGSLQFAMLAVAVLYNVTESAFRPDLLMNLVFLLAAVQLPAATATASIDRVVPAMARWPTYQTPSRSIEHSGREIGPREWRPRGSSRA
jgi:O-antigen ligase